MGEGQLSTINGDPGLFAGGVVMAASTYVATPAQVAAFSKVDLPVMFLTSTYDNPAWARSIRRTARSRRDTNNRSTFSSAITA